MKKFWPIMLTLMVTETVGTVSLSIVMPGLASWLQMFGNPTHVGWIMSAYLLMSAAAAALCGKLGDVFGRRRVLLLVLATVILGSVVSAVSESLVWIVAGRALQGVGGAVLPLVYALVREHLPEDRVPFAFGLVVAAASISSAFAFLVGGMLTDRFGPQSLFVAIAALSLVAMLASWTVLPRSTPPESRAAIDWLGGIIFAPGLAALLIALSNGRGWGWTSAPTIACLASGIGLLALWHWHERRQAEPLIDLRLLTGRNRALANLMMVAIALGVMQLTEVVAFLIQQPVSTGVGLGTSATIVGMIKFPAVACGVLGSIWAGWIAGRRGVRVPMIAGAALMLAASLIAIAAHDSIVVIMLFLALSMAGITAAYATIPIVIVQETESHRVGEATGLMAVIRAVAQGVGAQIIVVLLATSTVLGESGTQHPSPGAYRLTFLYIGLTTLCALILALAIRRPAAAATSTKEIKSHA